MGNHKKILLGLVLLFSVCAIMGVAMFFFINPQLSKGVNDFCNQITDSDSLMVANRHYGLVNYDKFVLLASSAKNINGRFEPERDIKQLGDSVFFKVNNPSLFYGKDDGVFWRNNFKNNPVSFSDSGFTAEIQVIDSVKYLYIPYQILTSVANYVEGSNEDGAASQASLDSEQRHTLKRTDRDDLNERALASTGKIQTGGYVFNNATDILKDHVDIQGNKHAQLKAIWKYVYGHWNYINDPYDTKDTWRSASETIKNYYFVSGECYSGDCDDFAILMASFARQVGYRSRVVTAYNNSGAGHAYAQYLDGKTWKSMDWFGGFDGTPFEGTIDGVYENL